MARTKKKPEVAIVWRKGRAYGDFRAYEDIGGKREALKEPGTGWGTQDQEIARILFRERLEELQAKRRGRAGGPDRKSTRLDRLVRDHLVQKKLAGKTSESHLIDLDHRLRVAVEHFGASRDPRTIEPADIREWAEKLSQAGKRKPETVRHYLNALSGLYGRAQEGLYVDPKYNPVQMLQEKPSGYHRGEATFLEVHDAALLLESARVLEAKGEGPPRPGGAKSERHPGDSRGRPSARSPYGRSYAKSFTGTCTPRAARPGSPVSSSRGATDRGCGIFGSPWRKWRDFAAWSRERSGPAGSAIPIARRDSRPCSAPSDPAGSPPIRRDGNMSR